MNKKIGLLLVTMVMVLSLVVAGCAPKAEPAPTAAPTAAPTEEPAVGEPQYGGTLTVACRRHGAVSDCLGWDVMWSPSTQSSWFVAPVQESVLIADMERGATGTGEHRFQGRYLPFEFLDSDLSLVESWEFLEDPQRLVYHVRPGIYWQDKPGVMEAREFTADDIAWNVQHHLDCPTATQGWAEFLKSIRVEDKYTVVFELNFPFPDFGYWFVWGQYTRMMPPEQVEAGAEDWHNLCGTGPFTLANYVSGSHMEYAKYPEYRGTTTINGKEYQTPFVDKLVYPIMADDAVRLAALRTGKVDIWEDVPWAYTETLNTSDPELRSWVVDPEGAYCLSLRQDIGSPFDILEVRRAMNMAIDRDVIIDELYGGYGKALNYPIAASFPENVYTPLEKLPAAAQELYEYDPDKAKELLAEAGYADGFDAQVVFASNPLQVDIMALVKDYWADVGINLELKVVDPTTLSAIRISKSHEQMLAVFDSTPTPGADFIARYKPGESSNTAMVDDPHFNDLMYRWNHTLDLDEVNALMKEANVYLVEQSYDIFLPESGLFLYSWPWVKHYEGELQTSYVSAVQAHAIAWIDEDMKAEMGY